jgi:protein-tyrosine kinase
VSNIFGALRKGGASTPDLEVDFEPEPAFARDHHTAPETPAGESFALEDLRSEALSPVRPLPRPLSVAARVAATAPSLSENGVRQVRLHLSALAPVLPFDASNQRAAEQYSIIRTKILHHARKPQFVLISSATSGDGKTITSINLAGSLALQADARVLLIDGDLRQPSVARTLGIAAAPGLSDVLANKVDLESALVQAAELPNLYVLPAGEYCARAADLLDSERWRTLAATLRSRFSSIVCDAPPIATVADYELLQLAADGLIVVARPGHTERHACRKALAGVDARKMLGVVLNCFEDWWLWKTPSYGYYARRPGEEKR